MLPSKEVKSNIPSRYLFIGLETAVQVIATSTNRVLRTLQPKAGQKVIGFKLCPVNREVIYIFTSASVTKWDWDSGKQIDRQKTDETRIAVDVPTIEEESQLLSYNITAKDGKRQISVHALDTENATGKVVLETKEPIDKIQVLNGGKVIFASDGARLFLGSTPAVGLEHLQSLSYNWREITLPSTSSCFHLQAGVTESKSSKGAESIIDLVLGETNGSILIYQDVLNTVFGRNADKKAAPRKLHWHRGPVSAVRWSKDGKSRSFREQWINSSNSVFH